MSDPMAWNRIYNTIDNYLIIKEMVWRMDVKLKRKEAKDQKPPYNHYSVWLFKFTIECFIA